MLQKLERKMQRAKNKGKGRSLSKKLAQARKAQAEAVGLAEDLRILADWMQNDIQNLDKNLPRYLQQETQLRKKLRDKFDRIKTAVRETLAETPRASSIVENLNSRLRNYFFLRRHIGDEYLHLLRFFLNHR